MTVLSNLLARGLPALALVSALVIPVVLFQYTDVLPDYWTTPVIKDLLLWFAAVGLLAGVLRIALPRHAAAILTAAVAIYLMLVVGIVSSLSALLFFASCTVLGLLLIEWMVPAESEAPLLAGMCTGLALSLALFGVLIHYPVNYRLPYILLQLSPFALLLISGKTEGYGARLFSGLQQIHLRLQDMDFRGWTMMLALLGYLARHAFYPSISYDDNALHLRLWTELSFQHMASFDVRSLAWIVAPFATDLMHAVISLGAASDARAALNLVFLTLLIQQVWQLLGHFVESDTHRAFLLLLFASTPLLGNLLITLQTELVMALLATIAMNLVLEMPARWYSTRTIALLAIAALYCAIKLPGAVLGVMVLASAVVKVLTGQHAEKLRDLNARRFSLLAVYVVALALLAFNAYFTAWRRTGNPVFPLYNAIFQSPLYELENFADGRWITGFNVSSYWNMFFRTSEHYETSDFVAGFQYLLLLPLALAALWFLPARRKYLLLLIPLLGFGVVMFAATQYWRYLFPVLPLASVVLAALLGNLQPSKSSPLWTKAAPVFALASCLLLNIRFYPGITWVFSISPLDTMTLRQRELLEEQHVPVIAATRRINATLAGSKVLYPDENAFGATLNGEPYYLLAPYAPLHYAKALAVKDEQGIAAFLAEEQIDLVMWDLVTQHPPGSVKWQLGHFLARRGFPEFQIGSVIVYRVAAQDLLYSERYRLNAPQQATEQPLQVTADGVAVGGARSARYNVNFSCDGTTGFFVAQVNWDNGPAYYRLVPCEKSAGSFSESLPVPMGATSAYIFISTRDAARATVSSLSLEMN